MTVLATAQQFPNASLTLSISKSPNQVFPKFSTTFDFLPPIFTTVCVFYLVLRALDTVGNFYSDKKATALNWIEGRGKSVVFELRP
ncbi:hypothetical protein PHAVU_006G044800 [Phaseolus vulgaris]|uniref:Uncharacterized protein n=1 Tax=Phaseolus vulgaris TaxID=3885 RepID=V7BKJ1_PHAVU|nr:hypothetical protein PHAVU_006G044800g [Phaseolus vulgaris]ESW18482.1 hypothetical protein PHAVU_006G044800g [Phaseolus vulgaris]